MITLKLSDNYRGVEKRRIRLKNCPTFFPEFRFAFLDGADEHVTHTGSRQSVESASNSVHADHEQVLGSRVVRTVHHCSHRQTCKVRNIYCFFFKFPRPRQRLNQSLSCVPPLNKKNVAKIILCAPYVSTFCRKILFAYPSRYVSFWAKVCLGLKFPFLQNSPKEIRNLAPELPPRPLFDIAALPAINRLIRGKLTKICTEIQ